MTPATRVVVAPTSDAVRARPAVVEMQPAEEPNSDIEAPASSPYAPPPSSSDCDSYEAERADRKSAEREQSSHSLLSSFCGEACAQRLACLWCLQSSSARKPLLPVRDRSDAASSTVAPESSGAWASADDSRFPGSGGGLLQRRAKVDSSTDLEGGGAVTSSTHMGEHEPV